MSPSIEPAVIAAAAATAVAIVSFITNRATTRQTVEAGTANTIRALDAARDDRLWDKQTVAYEETVTYLLYLQVKRRHDIRSYRLDDDDGEEEQVEWLNESYKPGPWFELQGRLVAYASDEVVEAYELAHFAGREVHGLWIKWRVMADQMRGSIEAGDIETAQAGSGDVGTQLTGITQAIGKSRARKAKATAGEGGARDQAAAVVPEHSQRPGRRRPDGRLAHPCWPESPLGPNRGSSGTARQARHPPASGRGRPDRRQPPARRTSRPGCSTASATFGRNDRGESDPRPARTVAGL